MNLYNKIFGAFLRPALQKRMRRIIRGYRTLKKSGQLNSIASINRALTIQNLPINKDFFSKRVFGVNGLKYAEQIIRQYLLARMGGASLNKALLHSVGKHNGKVIYPLPAFWRRIIELEGYRVSNFWSAFLWQLNIFLWFWFGVFRIIKISLSGLCNFQSKNSSEKYSPYAYFDGLVECNFPIEGKGKKNIFSWYWLWPEKREDILALKHNVGGRESRLSIDNADIKYQASPVPNLDGIVPRLKYLSWGFSVSLIAFLGFVRGHWWHAFLLNQAAILGQVTYANPSGMAKEYLFHNSGWIYRPLWTYEAEAQGSSIIFYFYSTNCENFMRPNGQTAAPYGWKAMTWPRYLVWDRRQADFVEEMVGVKSEINIVGDIWFLSELEFNYPMAQNAISVFDVQPSRDSLYCSFGSDMEYYRPENSIMFLSDIGRLLADANRIFALKVKRYKGKSAHPKYRNFLEKLSLSNNFINIDSAVSAREMIEKCSAVISMPFTSTALLGRAAGKPSIYYDPTGLIQKNDPAAHGIPIISGEGELSAWISSIRSH